MRVVLDIFLLVDLISDIALKDFSVLVVNKQSIYGITNSDVKQASPLVNDLSIIYEEYIKGAKEEVQALRAAKYSSSHQI